MLLETRHSYKEPVVHGDDAIRMSSDMLFSDYMLNWLGIIRNSVEEVTYAGYERNVKNRVVPYFKKVGVTLENLSALDIEGFYEHCFNGSVLPCEHSQGSEICCSSRPDHRKSNGEGGPAKGPAVYRVVLYHGRSGAAF